MASTGLCTKCGATNPRTAVLCGECLSRLPWAPAADNAHGGGRVVDVEPEPAQSYPQEVHSDSHGGVPQGATFGQPGYFEQPGLSYPPGPSQWSGRNARTESGRIYPGPTTGCSTTGGGGGCACSCLGCGCLVVLLGMQLLSLLFHWIT